MRFRRPIEDAMVFVPTVERHSAVFRRRRHLVAIHATALRSPVGF
jgi:hypothetical protein